MNDERDVHESERVTALPMSGLLRGSAAPALSAPLAGADVEQDTTLSGGESGPNDTGLPQDAAGLDEHEPAAGMGMHAATPAIGAAADSAGGDAAGGKTGAPASEAATVWVAKEAFSIGDVAVGRMGDVEGGSATPGGPFAPMNTDVSGPAAMAMPGMNMPATNMPDMSMPDMPMPDMPMDMADAVGNFPPGENVVTLTRLEALNGGPFSADDIVVVPMGKTLVIDKDAALGGLIVQGTARVADIADIELSSDWVLVIGGGAFEVGTEASPHTHNFTLTLTGDDPGQDLNVSAILMEAGVPMMGGMMPMTIQNQDAFLMAMGAGSRVEIHGADAEKTSWTQLDGTAERGATTFALAEAPGWEVGDKIVIASTDFDNDQAEELTVTGVSNGGRTISFEPPLDYMHYGEIDSYNDPDGDVHRLDMRAEVALLSRNVKIQGDVTYNEGRALNQQSDGYGGHTMVMNGAEMYVSGAEFAYMGQAGILGKYPLHWHELGDVTGQYVTNSSVHHSFNKGITVHNTEGALVADNVVYETISHNYYLEERDTYGNDLIGNLGINARNVGRFNEIPRASDDEPSNFYTTNGFNDWIGNHAAGSDNKGFYFNLNERGFQGWTLGTVEDNAVHSSQDRGFYVNHSQFVRDSNPQGDADQPQKVDPWTVDGLTVYKIPSVGAYVQGTYGTFTNSAFAEMLSNARFRLNQTIEDSLIVGRSNNIGNPETNAERAEGRSLPDGNRDFQGFQFYDGPASLKNVMFDGFTEPGDGAIETSNAVHKTASFGASGITWGDNVAEANKISMEGGGNAIGNDAWARGIVDVDGSLTGQAGAILYQYSRDRDGSTVFNAGENYEIIEEWGAIVSYGSKSGTLRIDNNMANHGAIRGINESGLTIIRSDGETASGIATQIPIFTEFTYAIDYRDIEDQFRLYLHDMDWGDSIIFSLGPTPTGTSFTVDHPNTGESWAAREVSSMAMLQASPDTAVFRDSAGEVHIKLVAQMAHGYLWPQPGVAYEDALHSGVTVLVDTEADLDLRDLVYDDPRPGDTIGPPPLPDPPQAPNAAPDAQDDTFEVLAQAGRVRLDVMANDSDAETFGLRLVAVGDAGKGSVEIAGNKVVYTADAGARGADSFTYTIEDKGGRQSSATVAVQIDASAAASGRLELGRAEFEQSTTDAWQSVRFNKTIEDAVVILGPVSFNGAQAAVAELRNVSDTGFEMRIAEWAAGSGYHQLEAIGWMAASAGTHKLADGTVVQAGTSSARNDVAASVSFGPGFDNAPIVFAQIATDRDGRTATTRIDAVDEDGFEVQMQEAEAANGRRPGEEIDWIAIDEESLFFDNAGTFSLDENWAKLRSGPSKPDDVLLADMQSFNGADTAALRYQERPNGFAMAVQEDRTEDNETGHMFETVGYLVGQSGTYDLYS
ncbi:MAG: G8 domain-containing protein [Pseudomonadota bacterium]